MLKIGLTGGIGSGKTTIAKIFEVLGVPVFYSDYEAKKLINNNPVLISDIKNIFGDLIYINNTLDTKTVAKIVFNNKEYLNKLNNTVHPYVIEHFDSWSQKQNSKYVINESAISFENNLHTLNNLNILVVANQELRINRVIKRDKTTESQVLDRIKNQLDDDYKIKLANFIIYNNNDLSLIQQVLKIHKEILYL